MAQSRLSYRGSSTPGSAKGPNCRKSPSKTRYAKDTKFHKTDPLKYAEICKEIDALNK